MLHLNQQHQQQGKHNNLHQHQRHDHIREQLNGLVARVQTTEELIKESRDRQEQFVLKMQDRSTLMGNVSYQSQLVPPDAHRHERARQEVQAIESFIRQLGVKVNKLRCQMLMDHVEIFAQLSDIQRDILLIHLPRWHLDQQLANNGAQTEIYSLDCIQSWVEMLTDITWRLRNQLVSMHTLISSTAGMLPFEREQEMNSLGLRINKSLETLILNTFVVEKQPPQVMKTNTRFTSTVRYLCNPGFNVHHNNKPIVKVSILSEHNARAIKQRHQEILRSPWSYLQDPPAASFMPQLEPQQQQQHSPPDQPVAMPVDPQQQTVIYRSTTTASSVQQQPEESLFIMDPPPHYMETVNSPPHTAAAPPSTAAATITTTTTSATATTTSAPEQQQQQQVNSPAQQTQIPPTPAQQQQQQFFQQPQQYHQILQPQKVGPKPQQQQQQHLHHHLQQQQQQQQQQQPQQQQQQVHYLGYTQTNHHNHQHQQQSVCQQIISNKLNIDDFDPSGEILNNTNQIEYQESTGQLVCHFRNMQLKKIKRTEKKGTESVMDEKFILVFHVHFRIDEPYQATSPWFHLQGDMSFHVLALSLPVVVIVHGNQDPHAWATVTWHNAFARQDELLYQVPDKVSWRELGLVLSNKFRSYAGKGLNEQNLAYLAAKISRAKLEADEGIVSWNQFAKEPLPDMSFTFWEWFHSILKLTKDHLRDLWNADRIYGFVGKKGCVDLLLGSSYHEPVATGTFLLRYSETELGGVSICWAGPSRPTNNSNSFIQVWQRNSPTNASSNVIMHLQPFLGKDLQTRSLADRIRDLQDLLYLYPNLPKDEAFGSHYTPIITVDPLANGYIRPMLIQTLVANYPKTHSGNGSISDGTAVGAPATPNSYSQSSPDGIYADNNCVMNDFESNYSAFDPVS